MCRPFCVKFRTRIEWHWVIRALVELRMTGGLLVLRLVESGIRYVSLCRTRSCRLQSSRSTDAWANKSLVCAGGIVGDACNADSLKVQRVQDLIVGSPVVVLPCSNSVLGTGVHLVGNHRSTGVIWGRPTAPSAIPGPSPCFTFSAPVSVHFHVRDNDNDDDERKTQVYGAANYNRRGRYEKYYSILHHSAVKHTYRKCKLYSFAP